MAAPYVAAWVIMLHDENPRLALSRCALNNQSRIPPGQRRHRSGLIDSEDNSKYSGAV
jgi:hypothetical protein